MRYKQLRLMELQGTIHHLQLQVCYEMKVNGVRLCAYVADFVYFLPGDEEAVVEDVKGYRTRVYSLKKKLMRALYGISIREV